MARGTLIHDERLSVRIEPDGDAPCPWSRWPLGTALIAVLATVATLAPGGPALLVDLESPPGDRLEAWRWITGHLVHATPWHLLGNLAVLIPLGVLRERRVHALTFLSEYLLLAWVVALGVRSVHEGWNSYCGLSGVVYGWLAIVLIEGIASTAKPIDRSTGLIVAGLVLFLSIKSSSELLADGWLVSGAWLEAHMGVRYLPGSHCAGLLTGVLVGLGSPRWPRMRVVSPAPVPR